MPHACPWTHQDCFIQHSIIIIIFKNYYYYYLHPWVYSSQGLKAKKVKIKAGVTIGPGHRRSRKCRAEE